MAIKILFENKIKIKIGRMFESKDGNKKKIKKCPTYLPHFFGTSVCVCACVCALSLFLTGRMFVCQTYFEHFDEL